MSAEPSPARVETALQGGVLEVNLAGTWRITRPLPRWPEVLGDRRPQAVRLGLLNLGSWDSSLIRFVHEVVTWCRAAGVRCDSGDLPETVRRLAAQLVEGSEARASTARSANPFALVGLATADVWRQTRDLANFIGECTLSAVRVVKNPRRFRWRDCLEEMQQCGAMAVPIVSLASFLVGLTVAYTGAIILRQFGGDIWVADIVGLSMFREMGAMMTGMVVAGRTGAAYAAHLGNMKAGEELDALETFGVRVVDFLVLPRLIALTVMMPVLTIYANFVGLVGGMLVASSILSIPASAYWIEMQTTVDLSDVNSGIIKSLIFGMLVAVAGCLRGLQCERSAAGVGKAATSAVVTGILLIIVADAVFAVLFHVLGI
jgi:phospholipid/cholesterol/gamma-HCH transport system permease protein